MDEIKRRGDPENKDGRGERRDVELEERVRPIGRFLGRQEGRGGYIALEIEIEITEGKWSCISRSP